MSDGTDHRRTGSNGSASSDGDWPTAHGSVDASHMAIRRSRELIEKSMRVLSETHKLIPPLR